MGSLFSNIWMSLDEEIDSIETSRAKFESAINWRVRLDVLNCECVKQFSTCLMLMELPVKEIWDIVASHQDIFTRFLVIFSIYILQKCTQKVQCLVFCNKWFCNN